MARAPRKPENAVLFHHPDAVDTSRPRLMGRHAAGEGFLNGFVRHSGVDGFYVHAARPEHFDDFTRRVAAVDAESRPSHRVPLGEMAAAELGTLMIGDPLIGPFAWRRRATGGKGYSICGVNHTLSSEKAMDGIGDLLTAPLQPWDALVCTSDAVKTVIRQVLDNWADYLRQRTGGKVLAEFQLPVIPLGVECDVFARDERAEHERHAIRRGLGIGEDDVVVLFLGRLSFHAKAHPTPLYLALEEAAKRAGKHLHLIQAGWFASDAIEREIRAGAKTHAPSVNTIFLDGREPEVRQKVWFAADIFTSLSDNIQETFGLTPVEAMAAGLPVVVSDWNGYRDTVRQGIDGFTIPTWMPLPQSGGDLALPPESAFAGGASETAYDRYIGTVSQFTAVDIRAAADAFATLAGDDELRRRMGEAGARRARDTYDWRRVIAAYQALWSDLANIRHREKEIAPVTRDQPAQPLRDDPFSLFEAFPTETVDGDTVVRLSSAAGEDPADIDWRGRLAAVGVMRMNAFATDAMLGAADQEAILAKLSGDGPQTIYALAELLVPERRYLLTRTVAWMAKMGLVGLEPFKGRRRRKAEHARPAAGGPTSALIDLGVAARARGAYGVAARYFKRALENAPDDAVANNHYGELMAFARKFDEARRSFEAAVAKAPDFHPAHRNLGRVRFLEGDYAGAALALERAAEIVPKDAETKYLLGVCCRYSGATRDARRHLNKVVEMGAGGTDARAHLGLVERALGDARAARDAFQKVLDEAPNHVLARAAMMSLDAAETGDAAKDDKARRVGLYIHAKHHFPILKPLFAALGADGKRVHISADLRDLADFEPSVTLICDAPTERVRDLAPATLTVNVRQGLAERNFARRPTRSPLRAR